MKHLKKLAMACTLMLTIATVSMTAFASTYSTPAEAVAGVTGKTAEEISALFQSGKSFGAIAYDAGKLSEFHEEMLSIHKDALDEQVTSGAITQEQADAALTAYSTRHAECNGSGTGDGCGIAGGYGCGNGRGNGTGTGRGHHRGGGCYR